MNSLLSIDAQEAVYTIAYTSFRQGQYGEAIALFRTLTVANPRSRKFWMSLGACYQAKKEYNKALDVFERAVMLDPGDPYVHLYAASCFFAQRLAKKGLQALNWAMRVINRLPVEKQKQLKAHIALLRQVWKKEAVHG